jgi:AraC-like DNA-binding protein/quercetin dioxygenase-like cupin family protein
LHSGIAGDDASATMALLSLDVELLWVARYDYEPGWRLPLHAHADYFQLLYIAGGTGRALSGTEQVRFAAGQLLFVRPGLSHGLEANAASTVRTLDTKFIIRHAPLRQACERLNFCHPEAEPRIAALLEAMHAAARQHEPLTVEFCQTLLEQVLLLLLQKKSPGSSSEIPETTGPDRDDLCGHMEKFLRENCAEKIDQRVLSEKFHYSYRHLHAVWLKRHRESPLQALWNYRFTRATQLIRYSDYELKRIAEVTGFATVHHFTRVFTRIAGVSPARWRDRERRGIRQDIVMRPGFVNPALTIQTPKLGQPSAPKR